MRALFAGSVSVLLIVTAMGRISAHHAFSSQFDAAKPVKLSGAVTKMAWTNPHAWIYLDVKQPNGQVVNWGVEAGAPNALLRRGFNKNSMPPGTHIVVTGYRAKDGSNRANGEDILLPDGKTLFLGSSGTGAPSDTRKK